MDGAVGGENHRIEHGISPSSDYPDRLTVDSPETLSHSSWSLWISVVVIPIIPLLFAYHVFNYLVGCILQALPTALHLVVYLI